MKTAIYIEDGVAQLVLTPETEFEKTALKDFFEREPLEVKIHTGSFYDCRGGWVKQAGVSRMQGQDVIDRSIILTIRKDT